MSSDNKTSQYVFYTCGAALFTAAVGGLYYVYKKTSKPKLNEYLEEYLKEIQAMIKNNKEKTLTVEIVGHIFQVITETEDYLYNLENSDLEEERVAYIKNEQNYRMLFAETMQIRNEYFEKATKLVEGILKISFAQLDEILKQYDIKDTKDTLKKAKKPYKTLPDIEKSKVREAFIFQVQQKKQNERYAQEQMYIMNLNPDYRNQAMAQIYYVKNKLKDDIKSRFGFDEKFMEQLVEKHQLLADSEVKYYHDELNLIE
jgi:hypothetical protein